MRGVAPARLALSAPPRRALRSHRAAYCAAAASPPPLPRWARFSPATGRSHANSDVLVLLVGWLGCRREYLDRYEALYAARGYATLAVLPPVSSTLLPPLADAASRAFLAARPGQLLRAPEQRTLLHVASNGGFLFLSQLLRAARLPGAVDSSDAAAAAALAASARGLLLDCAPVVITPDTVARALAALARRGAADGKQPLPPARAAARAYLAAPPVRRRLAELHAAWGQGGDFGGDRLPFGPAPPALQALQPALRVPTACLYSATDVLVPPQDVRDWAAARAAAGCPPPKLTLFDDAPHVELLRYQPAQYDAAVGDWLAAALQDG